MELKVVIKNKQYELLCSDDFVEVMVEESGNFNNIIGDIEANGEQLNSLQVGEEFFLMGKSNSYHGVLESEKIVLTTFIPNRNVL
ncbi:hypothetical protein NDS46_30290 (plasmid) [Paenibacillus thiaminolyticus]|uniref:hypothetical protein n=1 Tax=Paenibacillus thiaminolyticus TaxID=49283 RepID=UPI00232D002D|nr:hypothetical protein [Paenibacillus thiaminolyticus]WCF11638.1 hypothetical protein NDS46_30290 [Paenibacillus thiaminolyticus]